MTNRLFTAGALLALLSCGRPAPHSSMTLVALPQGGTVAVHAMGSAPDTIVLLSGGPAFGSRYIQAAMAPLAKRHTLLFVDLRGRGDAPPAPAESLSMAGDLRDLEAVRSHLHLNRFALAGHDWGAGLALLYAIHHPTAVSRLALIGPMPDGITTIFEMTRLPHDSAGLARHAAAIASNLAVRDPVGYCREFWGFTLSPAEVVDPKVIRQLGSAICDVPPDRLVERQSIHQELYRSLGSWEWRDTMPQVSQPTLVVVGGEDDARVATATRWAREVADGRLLVLGKTAGFPWLDAPAAFASALEEFLAGSWPAHAVAREPAPVDRGS